MAPQQHLDVLIVGGGPVGLMMALELSIHNVSYRIVDKMPIRSNRSRALAIQPRTMEMLNRHGEAKELESRGKHVRGAALHSNGVRIFDPTFADIGFDDTEFSLPTMISQERTEHFLDECLAKHGKEVERPVAATDIVQDAEGVTVTLRKGDFKDAEGVEDRRTTEVIRARYVVGCDGAHSAVRHAATNIRFLGAAYPQEFMLADVHISDTNLPLDRVVTAFGTGCVLIFPMEGDLIRLVVSGSGLEIGDRAGGKDPVLEDLIPYFEKFLPPGRGTLHDPQWLARFRLHHRAVDHYRDGRLFVAGDAAHIHSPMGGQGMNTGMQDAVNLAWKLAAVVKSKKEACDVDGKAPGKNDDDEALLDSYHAERWPVGQEILHSSDRMFSLATWTNPIFVWLRGLLLPIIAPWAMGSLERRRTAFRWMSEFGVNYRGGPIAGTAADLKRNGPVQGGDRLPDGELRDASSGSLTTLHRLCAGPHWTLVLFSGIGSNAADEDRLDGFRKAFNDVVGAESSSTRRRRLGMTGEVKFITIYGAATVGSTGYVDVDATVHGRLGLASAGGYVLMRPDGYVAHVGELSAIRDLTSWLSS